MSCLKLISVKKWYDDTGFSGIVANYCVESSGITMQLFIPAKAWELAQTIDDALVAEIKERIDRERVM